ncbi:LacI family transcriptional regulator [Microtetraspora sp. NBRC 13810]|uniref:substrate-binding domain-containing protein n=1 Tax=Microtetraspora sp. NBRC 13810 TaxID=3030990 RepID=UPI0024A2841A|nr:substrate-binding domain-containing protein [Microtetraspora sp. NBRC 13810]GLW05186.1 LacI family transcriptional regulator [Microtetraspora sp. NBRC 13810]
MLAEERHEAILRELSRKGSVRVADLAASLGVSAVTIRHDVRELAGRGLLTRVHGGALSAPVTSGDGAAVEQLVRERAPEPETERDAAGREPYVLGMLVPQAAYYYPAVIRGAQAVARELGARITLAVSRYDLKEDRRQVAQLRASGVDGLLLTPSEDPTRSLQTEQWVNELDLPVVLVERRSSWPVDRVEQVATDHGYGAYLATCHLARLGHDQVALFARESKTTPWIREGYERAQRSLGLREGHLHLVPLSEADDPVPMDEHVDAFVRLVATGAVTAALVHNDMDALLLVRSLRARGISIPGDLAIATYDDEVAALADIPLTAVSPPKQAVGAEAVRMLVDRLDNPDRPLRSVLLRPELRVRASCGAPGR